MLEYKNMHLEKTASSFYNLTGILVTLYDESKNAFFSYPEELCGFCRKAQKNAYLAGQCQCNGWFGLEICDKTKKPYIYSCHMGLTEAIAPIYENGICIGYLMMRQILRDDRKQEAYQTCSTLAGQYHMQGLLEEFNQLKPLTKEFIDSAIHVLAVCTYHLYVKKLIKNNDGILAVQLKRYIETHLAETLTVDHICRQFYISRSKLYDVATTSFQTGISEYIRQRRIEKAKAQLTKTNDRIRDIAEQIGITDPNYFSRYFKESCGCTPREYRKNACAAGRGSKEL